MVFIGISAALFVYQNQNRVETGVNNKTHAHRENNKLICGPRAEMRLCIFITSPAPATFHKVAGRKTRAMKCVCARYSSNSQPAAEFISNLMRSAPVLEPLAQTMRSPLYEMFALAYVKLICKMPVHCCCRPRSLSVDMEITFVSG